MLSKHEQETNMFVQPQMTKSIIFKHSKTTTSCLLKMSLFIHQGYLYFLHVAGLFDPLVLFQLFQKPNCMCYHGHRGVSCSSYHLPENCPNLSLQAAESNVESVTNFCPVMHLSFTLVIAEFSLILLHYMKHIMSSQYNTFSRKGLPGNQDYLFSNNCTTGLIIS